MEQVDVAIVGGGPAGTAAARTAAEGGAETILIEKGVPRADRDTLGPDSTDAAGFLDFWEGIADEDPAEWPDEIIHQPLTGAEFNGPSESVTLTDTGLDSSYPYFGFTFDRRKFDDWQRSRAESAGATYRVGTGVRSVAPKEAASDTHDLSLSDGSVLHSESLVLADGPQRRVTIPVLDELLPADLSASEFLAPPDANHIAYQEYRRLPESEFEEDRIKFWWGWIPGHTAYPWIFPNSDGIARIGLTMPIGLSLSDVDAPYSYELIEPEDESMPSPREFLHRFLDRRFGDEYDVETDVPRLENYGKDQGTETYPISSTRPIESPTHRDIAVVGGAMGATSAFHEGGDHVALRTGKLAGSLAATGKLDRYNRAWKDAIGTEVRRNVTLGAMVRGYGPTDWDQVFSIGNSMLRTQAGAAPTIGSALSAGFPAFKLFLRYRFKKYQFRSDRYVQLESSMYESFR
jgi:electron-transferring-flavoprotein dehydrogenase